MAQAVAKHQRNLRPEYFIDIMIGDTDFNSELMKITIFSSIRSPFNYITLTLKSDPKKFLIEKIYGKEPIKVSINLTTEEMQLVEKVEMELLYLKSSLPLVPAPQQALKSTPDPATVQILTVPRRSTYFINRVVNKVFLNKTMYDIVSELIQQTGAKPEILKNGINPHVIDQLVVPAIPFNKAISYIHEKWGICSGPLQYFSHFSEDKIIVRDLSKSVKEQEHLVIHQLALDGKSENIIKKCTDGINYYTRHFTETSYDANIVLSRVANQVKHIVQPSDKLTDKVEYTVEDLCKKHGITSKSVNLIYDPSMKSSELYIQDSTGFETNAESCYHKISRMIPFLSKITLDVEGDMRLLNLSKVGFPVRFKTYTMENLDLDGKYVLTYSKFMFSRDLKGRGRGRSNLSGSDVWTTSCRLIIGRTTKIN